MSRMARSSSSFRPDVRGRSAILAVETLESRAVPAVVVSPVSVSVPEGQARMINFKLNKAPTADVTFTVQNLNPAEASIDKTSLNFTPANWKTWQTVTVTAVEDLIKDGNKTFKLITGTAVSSDVKYANAAVRDVTVKTIDSKRVAPIDPTRYAGDYTGNFSGRNANGTIGGTIVGRNAEMTLVINAPKAGLVDAVAVATGTIADDGTFAATTSGAISGASYKGKVVFGSDGEVTFEGTWKYKNLASGNWRINRFTMPPAQGVNA